MPILDRPCGRISYNVIEAAQSTGALPLLLSHGYGATSAMFAPNVPTLAIHREVITWDLRGHGGSESPEDPDCYQAASAIADMAAVLDERGVRRAVLGGHSLGGYLSLDFTLTHPDRVAGLVLIDTGPGYRNDEARSDWNRRAEATAVRLAERGVAGLGSGAELHADGHTDVNGLILAARGTLAQRDGHVMERLAEISVPALVVVGADDAPFLGAAQYLTRKLPGAREVVIPGAGHAPGIDQPEAFNAEVAAFLQEIAP
jgi:pimeloyl-ACP methyl ester carboxylesterase